MNIRNGKFLLKHIFIAMLMVCFALDTANGASTRSTNRVAAKRSASATPTTTTTTITQTTTTEESAPVVEETPEISVINKASVFDSAINANVGFGDSVSSNDSGLAEQIRKQRAALEARDNLNVVALNQQAGLGGKNACDGALRQCMQKICGNNFTKCASDGDTVFGDKLNKCRRDTTCTGEEFKLFTTEIKADRDLNAKLSSYQSVIDCGNNYNSCIQTECGATFGKCLGKTAADNAINKCATIAKNCMEQDSGLSARVGTVIARLREDAEKDVKTDEERMYKLRDLMKTQCEKFGAMFDERSFDCVYTVNFFAGSNQTTPMASRKRYAGDTFVCTQEWFGTNVTTYKENAYRETRAQTGASSAMLGSGVGTAVGLVTSGAIGRALDTQKSKKDLKKECKEQEKTFKNGECVDDDGGEEENEDANQSSPYDNDMLRAAKNNCAQDGGEWNIKKNTCNCKGKNKVWDSVLASCEDKDKVTKGPTWTEKKAACEEKKKTNPKCTFDVNTGDCPCNGKTSKTPSEKEITKAIDDINTAITNIKIGATLPTPKDLDVRNEPRVRSAIENWWKACKGLPKPTGVRSLKYTLNTDGTTQCIIDKCSESFVLDKQNTTCTLSTTSDGGGIKICPNRTKTTQDINNSINNMKIGTEFSFNKNCESSLADEITAWNTACTKMAPDFSKQILKTSKLQTSSNSIITLKCVVTDCVQPYSVKKDQTGCQIQRY